MFCSIHDTFFVNQIIIFFLVHSNKLKTLVTKTYFYEFERILVPNPG